jgi:hypothetical protein
MTPAEMEKNRLARLFSSSMMVVIRSLCPEGVNLALSAVNEVSKERRKPTACPNRSAIAGRAGLASRIANFGRNPLQ